MASVTAAMSASESSSSEVLVLSMVSASSLSNSCSPSIEKHKNYYKKGPLSGLREVPLREVPLREVPNKFIAVT